LLKAEIIAIGTELLLGQIVNSNAQFISDQLAMLGISVYYHSVVGDNPERIKAQLDISVRRSNLIIFTGGLGPTKDDLTKETIANFIHRSLVLDQDAMKSIEQYFSTRSMEMTENNRRQAMVIEGSSIFINDHGLAPGMAVFEKNILEDTEDTYFLLFPGPPKELQPMFTTYTVPYLLSILPEKKVLHSRVMRFCGIGESTLETRIQDLIDTQTNPTIAPYAKEGEVTLRLSSLTKDVDEAERAMERVITEITARVGEFLYGWDQDSLASVVVKGVGKKHLTMSTAESCTGGLLGHLISKVPGASQVFKGGSISYANEIKELQLGVPKEVLEQYGAVSEQTAQYMAEGVKERYQTDIGLSITGVAGPDSSEAKPVGLVYLGFSFPTYTIVKNIHLGGNREAIQLRAAKLALFYLVKELQKGE
jgi:nicotinamide-nucleotide amidase